MFWRFIPLTATITYRRRRCYNASVLQAERLIQAGEVRRSKYLSNWWEPNQLLIPLPPTAKIRLNSSPLARGYGRRTARRSGEKEEHHNAAHARRETLRWRAAHGVVRAHQHMLQWMYDINLCTVREEGVVFCASLHYIISLIPKTSEILKLEQS